MQFVVERMLFDSPSHRCFVANLVLFSVFEIEQAREDPELLRVLERVRRDLEGPANHQIRELLDRVKLDLEAHEFERAFGFVCYW